MGLKQEPSPAHRWVYEASARNIDLRAQRAYVALVFVLTLHRKMEEGDCGECGAPWPCGTVRVVNAALWAGSTNGGGME